MALKIVFIGYVWPEPQSSAAGLRNLNYIQACQNAGWEVVYLSPCQFNESAEQLRKQGIQTEMISANESRFDRLIAELKPEFVLFDRFVVEEQFGWRVREVWPDAVRVLETQDLHFVRKSRQKALLDENRFQPPFLTKTEWIEKDWIREIGSILRSDLTYLISSFERTLLIDEFGVSKDLLGLHRFHYSLPPHPRPWNERANFIFVGNYRHPPNLDAVFWLHREIWPKIKKRMPTASIQIFGAYPPREVMALNHSADGFQIQGPTSQLYEEFQKTRVSLAPLRFGAGIKGKISDSWYCGCPVVTTPIGAEGMTASPWPGRIGYSSDEIAAAAVDLYQDSEAWLKAQQSSLNIIRDEYSAQKNGPQLIQELIDLRSSLKVFRDRNRLGKILNFDLHQRSRYFSKWIEEKNKTPPLKE